MMVVIRSFSFVYMEIYLNFLSYLISTVQLMSAFYFGVPYGAVLYYIGDFTENDIFNMIFTKMKALLIK